MDTGSRYLTFWNPRKHRNLSAAGRGFPAQHRSDSQSGLFQEMGIDKELGGPVGVLKRVKPSIDRKRAFDGAPDPLITVQADGSTQWVKDIQDRQDTIRIVDEN